MNLIKPSFQIIEQGFTYQDICKQIEIAGRTCYKSEDKITENSAHDFVNRMVKSGHNAMLEHGTVYLFMPYDSSQEGITYIWDEVTERNCDPNVIKYDNNAYSKVHYDEDNNAYITTNYRVIKENHWDWDLQYICKPTEYHEKRITVKFITDQGILREFTRHRVFSFAVESTRYCNYSKDKFKHEITYIIPTWCTGIKEGDSFYNGLSNQDVKTPQEIMFLRSLQYDETTYFNLLEWGWRPQEARNVLPLATKCEIIMTGFIEDWKHFFDLRVLGTTGTPHPQAKELAEPLMKEFINHKYI